MMRQFKLILPVVVFMMTHLGASAARAMYDPKHGRWLQRDQNGLNASRSGEVHLDNQFKDGPNTYQYVRSQPNVYVDSSGQSAVRVKITGEMKLEMGPTEKPFGSNTHVLWRPGPGGAPLPCCCQVTFSQIVKTEVYKDRLFKKEWRDWHLDSGLYYKDVVPWTLDAPTASADLSDDPHHPDHKVYSLEQHFETVAVCTAGLDKNTAYGAITWGHKIVKDKGGNTAVKRWAPWEAEWESYPGKTRRTEYGAGREPSSTWKKLFEERLETPMFPDQIPGCPLLN